MSARDQLPVETAQDVADKHGRLIHHCKQLRKPVEHLGLKQFIAGFCRHKGDAEMIVYLQGVADAVRPCGRSRPRRRPQSNVRSCAKKGLTLAWERRLTRENHGLRIEAVSVNNRREVFLTVAELNRIAQHCTKQAQAIWAALLTGARRGELFKIRAKHIGVDTIALPASHTKTTRMRVIPIIPALRPWLEYFPLEITVDGAKSAWRRTPGQAGIEHVNFHDLRHSCASIMLGLGVELYTISEILAHCNVQTTQRYAHRQVDAQRPALGNLSEPVTPARAQK